MKDPRDALAKDVRLLLESVDRVRAAGVICLVDGRWLTINVNLTVLHDGMEEPHPLSLERDGICAFDVLLRKPEVDSIVAGLDRHGVQLPASCKCATIPGVSYSYPPQFRRRFFADRDLDIPWPCDEVTVQGGGYQCDPLPGRLDRFCDALPTMDPPITSRRALCRELGLYGDLAVDRAGGHLYVRRPLPARLMRVGNTRVLNEIEILVEAYGALARSFYVSVMPDADRRSAARIEAKDFEQVSPSQFRKMVVLREPGAVKVTLAVRDGEVADEEFAGVPWAPMLVHEQFDPECRLLETMLFGASRRGQKDSREFESGVSWLLHLCGGAAMHLGRKDGGKDLQAAPDLVVRAPSGDLLIGECSILGPTEAKVEKLRERAQAVAALLQRAGVSTRVRVAIFVGVDCDARFDGVEVIDVTRLKRIVDRLRGGRPDGLLWTA